MILPNPLRQQTALRAYRPSICVQCLYNPKSQRRRLHRVPQLTHDQAFAEHGVGRMLGPESYITAWRDYQSYLVDRLNKMTADTKDATRPTKDILVEYARSPTHASLFNHASMAWNNHSFFSTLSPTPTPISPSLEKKISASFSSIESFRATFLATANAMFGPGFVWLVKRDDYNRNSQALPELAILTTFIAGSPLPRAHYRKQEQDLNTSLQAGMFGPRSGNEPMMAPGAVMLEPMLCVNTWQHVWLHDYGFGGKREYLERWWDSVDWDVVERNGQFDAFGGRRGWGLGMASGTGSDLELGGHLGNEGVRHKGKDGGVR